MFAFLAKILLVARSRLTSRARLEAENIVYCFVNFGKTADARPTVHVLPSTLVAEVLSVAHQRWLATPGKKGQPHKDSQMRRLLQTTRAPLGLLITLTLRAGSISIGTRGTCLDLNRETCERDRNAH
jgi:hypothetical protein